MEFTKSTKKSGSYSPTLRKREWKAKLANHKRWVLLVSKSRHFWKILRDVETLREEKRQAEQNYRNSMPSSLLQQQRLRVCESTVASPFLVFIYYFSLLVVFGTARQRPAPRRPFWRKAAFGIHRPAQTAWRLENVLRRAQGRIWKSKVFSFFRAAKSTLTFTVSWIEMQNRYNNLFWIFNRRLKKLLKGKFSERKRERRSRSRSRSSDRHRRRRRSRSRDRSRDRYRRDRHRSRR